MQPHVNRPRLQVGAVPGSITRHDFAEDSTIRIIEYDSKSCIDRGDVPISEFLAELGSHRIPTRSRPRRARPAKPQSSALEASSRPDHPTAAAENHPTPSKISWLNIDGLANVDLLHALGEKFNLHALALEDVVNVVQRAKLDLYDDSVYIVLRMPYSVQPFKTEQLSLFLLDGTLVTLQEYPGDCLNPVRERLVASKGRIRMRGADYLAYAVIDAVVDGYFPVLEGFEQTLMDISDELDDELRDDIPKRLHDIRADLLTIRKIAVQHRDAVSELLREDSAIVSPETEPFLRDCLDHIARLVETADTYRETCGELRELYFAQLGQKTNDAMKVLTIIATIFIPMSFIAGVYGMNFDTSISPLNMPELNWTWGYPFAIFIMLTTGGGLLFYLKRKGWL